MRPSEWLPRVFGDGEPEFESQEEAQEVMTALLSLYNEANAPVSLWARGFTAGHLWLQETWDTYLAEETAEELAAALAVLSFFGSRSMAEVVTREMKDPDATLESTARKFRRLFPDAVAEYAATGQLLWKAILARSRPDPREAPGALLSGSGFRNVRM